MSTLTSYYSGDIVAARTAHRAHARRGNGRPVAPVAPRPAGRVDRAAYGHYDGDLGALLAALR